MRDINELIGRRREFFLRDFEDIIKSAEMEISPDVAYAVGGFLSELFDINTNGVLKTIPRSSSDNYSYSGRGGRGIFNIIPSDNTTNIITDTLVVYCKSNEKLSDRLADMIIAVNRHKFKNVFFITSKWDSSVVSGNNIQRMHDLFALKQSGTSMAFILMSTMGIHRIPVI